MGDGGFRYPLPERVLQAIALREEVRQQGNASTAPQQAAGMFAESGELVLIRRSGLHQQALRWGNRCRSGDIGRQHQIAGSMMRQHIAQNTVDLMAGVASGQQRLTTGDLLAHSRKMAEIAVTQGVMQQFAALLSASGGRTDDM